MKVSCVCGLLVIAICGTLVLGLYNKKIISPDADAKNIKPWATEVEKLFQQWGVRLPAPSAASADGATQSNAINRFLKLLARQENWQHLDALHADMEFLRRLPTSAKQVERNPRESDVRAAMLELLAWLAPGAEKVKQDEAAEAIVSRIARQMNYRLWYTGEGRTQLFHGRSAPPEARERAYLGQFYPPIVGGEDEGLSQALYKVMVDQWGVRGLVDDDLRRRPWFVVGCFFEFVALSAASEPAGAVSRPAEARQMKQAERNIIEQLQKHLPAESLVPRSRLREDNLERVIRNGLRDMAKMLDVPTDGRDDRTLLEAVRRRLEQVAESVLEKVRGEEVSPSLMWYLERLACRRPTPGQ